MITVREFRTNMKKYLDAADAGEVITIQRGNSHYTITSTDFLLTANITPPKKPQTQNKAPLAAVEPLQTPKVIKTKQDAAQAVKALTEPEMKPETAQERADRLMREEQRRRMGL